MQRIFWTIALVITLATLALAQSSNPTPVIGAPARSIWSTYITSTSGFVWTHMTFKKPVTFYRIDYTDWGSAPSCTTPDQIGILDITNGSSIVVSMNVVNGQTHMSSDVLGTAPAGHDIAIWTWTGTCTTHGGSGIVSIAYQ